jgi:PAS domain S-box-containing protein
MGDTERQLQDRLAAQHALARHLLQSDDLAGSAPAYLSAVCVLLGWPAGALWEVRPGDDALRFAAPWEAEGVDGSDLWEMSRSLRFGRGAGLPGRAWDSGEITWIPDLSRDADFPRLPAADALGFRAAFAIPVPIGPPSEVLAVSEFFAARFEPPDEALMTLLVGFADQLAMFIDRRRAEEALRASEGLKTAIVSAPLDAVVTMDAGGRIVEFNAAAERLFGHRREDALDQEMAALLIPPNLRRRHREGLARYLRSGEARILDRRVELEGLRRDGSTFPVELTVTRIPDAEPALFTGHLRDMSGRLAAERTQRHLAAIVSSTQDAVLSKDLDGNVVSWNAGAERMYGYTAEEAVGRHISFLVPDDHRNEEMRILERIARRERIDTYETQRLRKDGGRIEVSLTASPIEEAGRVVGASVVARDITLEKRRRQAQDFLARAGAEMDSSLDPETTARVIAATAVPELATLCVIDFLRPDGSIGGSVVGAGDPKVGADLEAIRRDAPLDPAGQHPVARALRDRRQVVIRDLTEPAVVADVAQSEAHRSFISRAGYNSAAVVPMIARGRAVGALSFLHVQNDLRYDREDLALLQELADRAAMAIDNARLYAERDRIAVDLQRDLRPEEPPQIPGIELALIYEPAGEGIDVGGDLYDFVETPEGLLVLLGDVTGKGSEAAAITAQIRHTVRALARDAWEPGDLMARLRELLTEEERFASLMVGQLRHRASPWKMALSVAGHPPALLRKTDGSVTPWGGGTILGPWRDCGWETHTVAIAPGEMLLLYTDGWLEAGPPAEHRTSEDLTSELIRLGGGPDQLTQALRKDALHRSRGRLRDDMILLALRNGKDGGTGTAAAFSSEVGAHG